MGTKEGRCLMDAKELTKKYYDLENRYTETKKQVEFLTQEFEKLRLLVDDLRIDVAMVNHRR